MSDMSGISSLYSSDYWKSASQAADLENRISNTKTEDMTSDELMDVCKDFEAYFVEQMFKSMEKMVPKSAESESKEKQMFGDILTQKYAEAATDQKSLGLAQMLYEQMKRNYGL